MFLGDRNPQQLVECGDKRDGIKCGLGKQMRKNGFQGKMSSAFGTLSLQCLYLILERTYKL